MFASGRTGAQAVIVANGQRSGDESQLPIPWLKRGYAAGAKEDIQGRSE